MFREEKIPYLNAVIKEAGRYYTVSAMSLPRKTVTDVNWDGAIIPAKTMILINAQAANHGEDYLYTNFIVGMLTKTQMFPTLAHRPQNLTRKDGLTPSFLNRPQHLQRNQQQVLIICRSGPDHALVLAKL